MKPGDKVVCVDDSPCRCGNCNGRPAGLIKNNVYVIADIWEHQLGIVIDVVGTVNPPEGKHMTNTFGAYRFRLLDEMKQEAKHAKDIKHSKPARKGLTSQSLAA